MAEDPALSLRVSEIKNPAVLFERYNTEEIRQIERKVRREIEQKKEELRQMVGERYRDLIDAADTIGEMRQCSAGVVQSVDDMHRYCQRLKRGRTAASGPESHRTRQEKLYTMASQIKLLLEIPERIWSALEASQYLLATQLYLLCCHLQTLLQLHTAAGGQYSPVLARFPILVRQVATMGHFRSTILLESKALLRGRVVSDQAIAEALVATMLLEDSSPRQALADFLLARKSSVHQLLNQPQHGSGIKSQVCSLVELLVTTLFQAYAVFYLPTEGGQKPVEGGLSCGLLFSTLENVTSTTPAAKHMVLQEESSTSRWFKYLPPGITGFQPTLRTLAQPIQREHLHDTLQQWIDTVSEPLFTNISPTVHMTFSAQGLCFQRLCPNELASNSCNIQGYTSCKEDICKGVGSLLVYIKSLKGLAAIRDAVWDLLSTESISHHWSTVCQRLLERPLAVWDDFLQPLFLQHVKTITQEETEAISASSVQLLTSAMKDLEGKTSASSTNPGFGHGVKHEVDIASFLWSESPGDLLSDAGWVSVTQRKHQQQRSGLTMKTQALTPYVQNVCFSMDAKLKARLDDLQHYVPFQDTGPDSTASSSGPAESSSTSSFNRFMDAPAVEEALREGCLACVRYILSSIRSELFAATPNLSPPHISSVLFMARICQSIGELCPNLKHCILGKQNSSEALGKGTPRQSKKGGKARTTMDVSAAQAAWASLSEELLHCSMEAYHVWSSSVCKTLLDAFGTALRADRGGAILTTTTHWGDLEIQEEAESGSSVTSKVRLPVQPSWFVQSLLFRLCVEVNKVGGHALPRPTSQELLQACLTQVLQQYHSLLQQPSGFPMTQNRALQWLFDLRYLSLTLGSRLEEGRSSRGHHDQRFYEVCDWLEGFIDPFDLDVFTPILNANVSCLSQKTSVLLGLLTPSEKQFSSRSSGVNCHEPHNILPLASSQTRFGLLPLSMSSTQKPTSASRGCDAPRQLASSSTAGGDDSFQPGSLFRQLADQDEDVAAPSLFKLSWLSSMTK